MKRHSQFQDLISSLFDQHLKFGGNIVGIVERVNRIWDVIGNAIDDLREKHRPTKDSVKLAGNGLELTNLHHEDEISPIEDRLIDLAGEMRYQAGQSVQEGTRFGLENAGQLYRSRYWQEAQMQAVDQLKQLCDEHKVSITRVALAWVLAQPAITSAIVGTSKAEQLDQSLPTIDLTLDEQLLAACDDIWYQLPLERNKDIAFR